MVVTGLQYLKQAQQHEGAGYSQDYSLRLGPTHFDCSGLVWKAASNLGVSVSHGTVAQGKTFTPVPLRKALVTPGAILWRVGHNGISLGDTRSIEARNPQYGVSTMDYKFGNFTNGFFIPGITYSPGYPYARLTLDGNLGDAPDMSNPMGLVTGSKTMLAWKWYLRFAGYADVNVYLQLQKFLKDKKFYTGLLDSDFGGRSATALQNFLKSEQVYFGKVDGDRGSMTITAEQAFLNRAALTLT